MPHVRVDVFRCRPGTADRLIQAAQEELLPLLQCQPGFRASEVIKAGEDAAICVSTWASRQQAGTVRRTAQPWVQAHQGAIRDLLAVLA